MRSISDKTDQKFITFRVLLDFWTDKFNHIGKLGKLVYNLSLEHLNSILCNCRTLSRQRAQCFVVKMMLNLINTATHFPIF